MINYSEQPKNGEVTKHLISMSSNRKKRSSEEIVASMLFMAKGGMSKTAIMYASYLSFRQLKKYINFGLRSKLVYVDAQGKYFTTPKGFEYLKCFEELQKIENNAFAARKLLDEIIERGSQIS